jgi:hypothetical protein
MAPWSLPVMMTLVYLPRRKPSPRGRRICRAGDRLGGIAEVHESAEPARWRSGDGHRLLARQSWRQSIFLQRSGSVSSAELDVLSNAPFATLEELVVGNVGATNPKPLPAIPPRQTAAARAAEAPEARTCWRPRSRDHRRYLKDVILSSGRVGVKICQIRRHRATLAPRL